MIGYFAEIYEDELFASAVSRTFGSSGYLSNRAFANEIYSNQKEAIDYLFFNSYKKSFTDTIKHLISKKEIICHSLTPYFLIGIDKISKKRMLNISYRLDRKYYNHLPLPKDVNKKLLFCPMCYLEDIKQKMQPYIRTSHQVANVCYRHGCKLIESDIFCHQKTTCNFKTLPNNKEFNNILCLTNLNPDVKYAIYVHDIMKFQCLLPESNIKEFLRNELPNKYFVGKTYSKINSKLLYADISEFYKDSKEFNITRYRLKSILNGTQRNVKSYLMVCLFLGISPKRAITRPKQVFSKEQQRINEIIEEYKNTRSIHKVEKAMSIDRKIVSRIIKHSCYNNKKCNTQLYTKRR